MADIISGKSRFQNRKKVVSINYGSYEGYGKNDYDTNNDSDEDEKSYKRKIKQHKRRIAVVSAAIMILTAVAVGCVIYFIDDISYKDYRVVKSVNRDDSESADYINFGDGYVRYSNDGIAYRKMNGDVVWDKTFTMTKPQVKVCKNIIAVGDITGSKIYVFDKKGIIADAVDTSLPISQIEVSEQGLVAAVLEDTDCNYINMYDTNGKKIYSVKTSLSGDGYPMDISISEDGTKLMASFLYVSGESMKTNVVFYNFSEVGQNETERVVGGFNHYNDMIVGDVEFMNKTTAVAIGERIISIYSISEYPKLKKEIPIDNNIEKVFFSSDYVGIITDNSDSVDIYRLDVYDLNGNKKMETSFSTQYSDVRFDGKSVILNTQTEFTLYNFKGKKLADIKMQLPVTRILGLNRRGEYICVNSKYIQEIKLK